MTKIEQLKARAYVIEVLEEEITKQEQIKEYYIGEKPEELGEYERKQLIEADDKIRKLEYMMEEIAK